MPRSTQNSQVSTSSLHRRIKHVKRLREMYDPRKEKLKIRILFVGESPPRDAPQIFFYNRTSILYYATFLAFHRKFGIKEHDFLKFFKRSGCYLYDLFEVPGMVIQGEEKEGRIRASKHEVEKAKGELEKFILSERPEIVIVVIKQVFDKIKKLLRRLKEQGVIKEYFSLPFPINSRSFTKYIDELSSILDYALGKT